MQHLDLQWWGNGCSHRMSHEWRRWLLWLLMIE